MRNKKILLALLTAGLMSGVAQAQTTIKIGVLNDQSGIGSSLGGAGSILAAKMAIEDFTAKHKNVKVELVTADHQNKADIGSSLAREWYDQKGVDAIFDVQTSSVALAVSDITKAKNKVMVNSGAGSADLTGSKCTPNNVHWTYDTWALANATGSALVKRGGNSWYFITADYAFGHALEKDTTAVVTKAGGKVLGSVRHPFAAPDFSSFLLQAQASKAKVIGLATSAGDLVNLIKQASEFKVRESGQTLAGLLIFISDVDGLGLKAAQGLLLSESFYWDLNEGTRTWSQRFAERHKNKMPTMVHAGVYAGVTHYLKAATALGSSSDGAKVVAKMKEMPTDDPLFGKGEIRIDGRKIHPMYLFEVKRPEESKGPFDYYKMIATIPADEAFRPLAEGGCSLVK
ncbi:ABC transporter substrate-binding protein [Janthinobacterium sp. 17J80-10]|uniref:ABC transporter substrate-binding protein n=1 Tax=Janthinobacterium sp. 17J80-10 TaxID=2497863 RepID=UPI0010052BC7|nr:ABC transporter substrate-binding protein [Janthinobacterium sp. 17J80-10]QAU33257.1 ABC transporter substrate-binding protein [Janthinobacterium sp. 17J80-10]